MILTFAQFLLAFAALLAAASAGLSARQAKTSPWPLVHYALLTVVFALFAQLVWINHHTSRTSSTLVLLFFPIYLLASAISVRTAVLTGALAGGLNDTVTGRLLIAREALWFSSVGLGFIAFVLELYTPEKHWKAYRAPWARRGIRLEEDEEHDSFNGGPTKPQENDEMESPVATANIYER